MCKKILLSMLIIFMFVACAATTPSSAKVFNKEEFDKGGYTYVIISAVNNASTTTTSLLNVTRTVIAHNFFEFTNEKGQRIEFSIDENAGIMIPAGNYTLTRYELWGSKGNLRIDLDFSNDVYGSFKAPAGKAIYLGTVETIITKNNKDLFKKIFNIRTTTSDIEFETHVNDDFLDMKSKYEMKVEKESGLPLEKGKLNWMRR